MTAGDMTDLIEMIQRGQEQIDQAQRQERALALQKFADYHSSTTSNYQRTLDEVYRIQRLVLDLGKKVDRVEEWSARLDQGQKDMQVATGQYQDTEQLERHTRQELNDRHFRRIYRWLIVLSVLALFIAGRIAYVLWGGV